MATQIKRNAFAALGTTLALAAVWPGLAQGREIKSLDEMQAAVRENMPAFLKDPGEVVGQLLNIPLEPPLSQTFDRAKAIKAVFGDGSVSIATDCRRRATPSGDPDQGDCMATSGSQGGKGAFLLLNFSKNMGNGNIKFLKRPPVDDNMTADKLPKARLSDDDALKQAQAFLGGAFGLSMAEIPMPPAGAKTSLVRSLAMAGTDDGRAVTPIVVQKVVYLQRGFKLEKPYTDGVNGPALTHVRGPGKAMVAVDDSGVVGAMVAGWQELRKDPKMTADAAKPVDALIGEIAEDLFNHGVRQFEKMSFEVQVGADWRGAYGLLLPAVQVAVTPVPADPNEDQQALLALQSTAGLVKSYSLVEQADAGTRQ